MAGHIAPKEPEIEKIRVLIVDDVIETRENLKKLLFFESDIEVVGTAMDGQEGVDMAYDLKPDVILMDLNMPNMDGIQASELIIHELPETQIIIISAQSESHYLRRAMLAGARQFLIKPFSSNELVTSVRRVYQLGKEQEKRKQKQIDQLSKEAAEKEEGEAKGQIIAMFSPKGGTGCSTLATNLAIAMQQIVNESKTDEEEEESEEKTKIVLVDAGFQFGDVAALLNIRVKATIADIAPLYEELDEELLESVLMEHDSGLKTLLAPPRPEMAELVSPEAVSTIIKKLRRMFDIIIVDTYSTLQETLINILDECKLIVLVTTPEIPAIKSARLFFEITQALNYPPEKTQLVLNKSDRRSSIRSADIEASIKRRVEAQFSIDELVVTTAINQGVPYVIADSSSVLSRETHAYAKKLHDYVLQPELELT